MDKPISRDAGDKTKGPRLQKLRAVELLLKAVEGSGVSHVYVATEFEGDVSLHTASATNSKTYVEENKNYDENKSFTFASEQVLNTMVSFLDSWVRWSCNSTVRFGFYCPNTVGKERKSSRTDRLGIKLPNDPILKTLLLLKPDDTLVDDLAKLIKDEYNLQYKKKTSNGCIGVLEKWNTEQWSAFFSIIEWKLGESDEIEVKKNVTELIKNSKYYCQQHSGKEEQIAAMAMELLDERQSLKEPTDRFVYSSDIENLFLKTASSDDVLLPDPAWEMWESLSPPSDRRNIESKVKTISKSVSKPQIGRWSRKAASGFKTEQKYGTDKSILALKYRIYTACSDRWDEFLDSRDGQTLSPKQIREWVTKISEHCKDVVKDLGMDHGYSVSNSVFVEEMIWVLIDECYLSFDREPAA